MHDVLTHGDCLDVLRNMPGNSVDSIVTDPPYGIKRHGTKMFPHKPSGKNVCAYSSPVVICCPSRDPVLNTGYQRVLRMRALKYVT